MGRVSPAPAIPILLAAMHRQIVEAIRQLTRRYVANAPHCGAMWIALTEKSRRRWNRPRGSMLSGQVFGAGGMIAIPLPNIGSMGGAYGRARKEPFPAPFVDPDRSCFAALNPFCGADRSRMGCWEGIASACSASNAGRRGWVERSETHPRVTA